MPLIEKRLFLIDCPVDEQELSLRDPALFRYLKAGEPSVAKGYLCHSRSPWYSQEARPPSPFLCTYMGRAGMEIERHSASFITIPPQRQRTFICYSTRVLPCVRLS